MDLDTLKMIVALAEEKSVARAAERLNIKESEVHNFCNRFSRETKTHFLDMAFVNKFVSGQGMELYKKAKKVLDDLETCGKWMSDLEPEPAGDLTIVTMPFTGIEWLMPKLKPFLEKYPKVRIKVVLKHPPIQPGEGDVVITFPSVMGTKGFRSQELISIAYSLYASPEYLEKNGKPESLKDLDNHHLINFGFGYTTLEGHYSWSLNAGRNKGSSPRTPYFEIDSSLGTFKAARLGLGIAELPNFDFITQCADLVNIMPSFESSEARLNYICEKNRENTPLIGELYKHLRSYSFLNFTKSDFIL